MTQSTVPEVGSTAPDFTLPSTNGESVTLSSLRGRKVLVAFFPLAFTSTCTQELCDMRDEWDKFSTTETIVLPISVDSTPTLKEFKQKHGFQVEFLSDFRRDVSRMYGVLIEERFFSNRAYFLVGADGTLNWSHVEKHPGEKRTNDELLAAINGVGA